MNRLMMLCALCLLAGCAKNITEDVHLAARGGAIYVRDEFKQTVQRVKGYFILPPYQSQLPKPPQTAYCYRTQGDILCYRKPLPGAETRLVAVQGEFQADAVPEAQKTADGAASPPLVPQEPPLVSAKDRAPASPLPYRPIDPQPIFVGMAPGAATAEKAPNKSGGGSAGTPRDLMTQ